jgi:hypothetical protein
MSVVEIVDRLAAVCVDSEKRYRHAANDVSRDDLQAFFNRQAEIRGSAASELQAARVRYGSAKEESGKGQRAAVRATISELERVLGTYGGPRS